MKIISCRSLAALLAVVLLGTTSLQAETPAAGKGETPAERAARMKWWHEARFGMFIHWGLYSVPAGTYHGKRIGGIGEWIMNTAEIPVAEYAAYAKQFNPVKFDADQWVSIAKNAGMKYIVITAKHHDGFAMFKSDASKYNIVDATPFHRDPLAELAVACRKQGIKLGFYYSQAQDWHHPGGGAYHAGGHWDKAQDGNMDDYVRKIAAPQVREILSHYGPVAVLWWDTPVNMTPSQIELLSSLLKLQPGIISNNRLGGSVPGDTETPEQFIPLAGYPGRDWETCMTLNDTWGYKSYDQDWKPAPTLIRNLIDIASKGGNYLLNVGPNSLGEIPAPSVERLATVGKWLKANGEAIYGSTASPFKSPLAWGRVTQKPGKLFLHVFNWPQDGTLKVGVSNKVAKAYLLASPAETLAVATEADGVHVKLPATAPDAVATVVVLELDGPPQVVVTTLKPAADGSVTLDAADADISGTAQLEQKGGHVNVGFWLNRDTNVSWLVTAPGTYDVQLTYACNPGSEGCTFELTAGSGKLAGTIAATRGWDDFKTVALGKLQVPAGQTKIALQPKTMPHGGVMNLASLKLTPAK